MKQQELIMQVLVKKECMKMTIPDISNATRIKGKKDELATVRGRLCMLFNEGFVKRGSLLGEVAYWTTKEMYDTFLKSRKKPMMVKAHA